MTHITDYGGAIDDYYPARIERIADMELTELEKRADIEAEKSRMKPEVLDGGWQPIETAPKYEHQKPILVRNKNQWPEICYIKSGMAFDHRGYAMVGFTPKEWFAPAGRLNWGGINE